MEHLTIRTLLDIAGFLSAQHGGTTENEAGVYYRGAVPGSWYHRIQIRAGFLESHGIQAAMDAVRQMAPEGEPVLCSVYRPERDDALRIFLEAHHYPIVNPQTAMQLDLRTLSECEDSGVSVIPSGRLREWSACCAAAFPKKDEYPCFEALSEHCTFYGYQVDGSITATLMLNTVDTLAGLHEVATRAENRGQGQATKLVRRALWDARERGCTTAVLQASARGYPLYRRLGFVDSGFLYNFRFSAEGL